MTIFRCKDCGNEDEFVTEANLLHWIRVDGDGTFVSDEGLQGDEDAPTGTEDIDPGPRSYVECACCSSNRITIDEDFDELMAERYGEEY